MQISRGILKSVFGKMKGRTKYLLGAKAPSLSVDSGDVDKIDCSGFSRLAISKASGGTWKIPDGSQNQLAYFEDLAEKGVIHKLAKPSDVGLPAVAADENRVFIAFIKAKPGKVGHVWLIQGGKTMESHGGKGVNSRPWDTRSLAKAYAAFELPSTD